MTEQEIKQLGFTLAEEFPHDQFHTNRYKNGVMTVDFTYENGKLLASDLTIDEVSVIPITLDEMKALTEVLGDN